MASKRLSGGEDRKLLIQNTVLVLIVVFVFLFFGYSVVVGRSETKIESHFVDTDVLSEYMSGLSNDSEATDLIDDVQEDVSEQEVEE